jgi:hypothetical protein
MLAQRLCFSTPGFHDHSTGINHCHSHHDTTLSVVLCDSLHGNANLQLASSSSAKPAFQQQEPDSQAVL